MPSVVKPVFIVGVGRSGSTIFHQILAHHPQVMWLSSLLERYPSAYRLQRLHTRALDVPLLGSAVERRFEAGECYSFWDRHYRGFSTPCRDLQAGDVTPRAHDGLRRAFTQLLTRKRHRVLAKITGWPRIGFLNEIFPDAIYIHVVRDPRPVVNSFLTVDWWWGWRGPENWRWGELSAEHRQEWEAHERSFVALAGIQWKILMEAMEKARACIDPARFLEIRYEALCKDPLGVFRRSLEHCDLPATESFDSFVRHTKLSSENEKWRQNLTPKQQATLETVLRPLLERYSY